MKHQTVAGKIAAMLGAVGAGIAVFAAASAYPAQVVATAKLSNVLGQGAIAVSVSYAIGWAPMYARYRRSTEVDPDWRELIANARRASAGERLEYVNGAVNRARYSSDIQTWGKLDYWATPTEFFSRGGDCEDFAISKFLALRELGSPSSQMRILVLRAGSGSPAHAVLVVETEAGPMVLDNLRNGTYPLSSRLTSRVAFALNDTKMWVPRPLPLVTAAAGGSRISIHLTPGGASDD